MSTLDNSGIHQLLAERYEIAIIWSFEDVQGVRPDLNADQAWEVLQCCDDQHDCEWGFTWGFLKQVADDMFPEAAEGVVP